MLFRKSNGFVLLIDNDLAGTIFDVAVDGCTLLRLLENAVGCFAVICCLTKEGCTLGIT